MLTPTMLRKEMMTPNGCGSTLQLANLFPMLLLSKALRREQYSSDEARMLQKSLAKFREEQLEELADAGACSVLFGEREDREEASVLRMLGGPLS